MNRKHFYGLLREDLLARLANMLDGTNNLMRSFATLKDFEDSSKIPEDMKLVIHAHDRTNPGQDRKYNIPEASEVAALIASVQYGALETVLRRKGCLNANGFEKLDVIRLSNRMYEPLCYPLLFPYANDGWHSKLLHLDRKGKQQKVSPLKFFPECCFNGSAISTYCYTQVVFFSSTCAECL